DRLRRECSTLRRSYIIQKIQMVKEVMNRGNEGHLLDKSRAGSNSKRTAREHFAPDQRLDVLRAGDCFRKWSSLDDKRVCIVCRRIFRGRQVEISREKDGRFLLRCP